MEFSIEWSRFRLEFGPRTRIMGILNVTPDSFSDGGKFLSFDEAVAQGEKLVEEGADILDVGGESTRPFAEPVSVKEEIRRVVPVIETLAERVSVPISIDTTKAEVALAAIHAGASMINDISACRFDPEIAGLAAESGVPLVLMHMKGTPEDMQKAPAYQDLLGEVRNFLEERIAFAESKGVSRTRMIADPGIGFGKSVQHNFQIIRGLPFFLELKVPLLVGTSRKYFIRKTIDPQGISPESPEVETGTQATVAAAVLRGAHLVRVHHVANTRMSLKIIDAIRNA
jgi:dihydropteroate synthase